MSAAYCVRAVKALRVFCPIEAYTLRAMLSGDASAMERDPTLSRLLNVIRSASPLGDFGIYKSVVEIAPGWELFSPADDAEPTLGEVGSTTRSPTAILIIYLPMDASREAVDNAIGALLAAHPWEIPVVELSETSLVTRVRAATQS